MTRPVSLTKPPLSAYLFINFMLFDSRNFGDTVIIPHAFPEEKWTFNDRSFVSANFADASKIKPEQMAPLAAMTDATFEGLVGTFGYVINGVPIKNKDDMALAATSVHPDFGDWDDHWSTGDESIEQNQAFFLHYWTDDITVDWRHVVELYNTSEPDQQEAILQYFKQILNRSLEDLLEMPGPEPLPANLVPELETQVINGKPCSYDAITDKFVEDSILAFNFRVTAYPDKGSERSCPIATAMTLEEALAYGSRFIMNAEIDPNIDRLDIQHRGHVIASADIEISYANVQGKLQAELPVKPRWKTDYQNPVIQQDALQKMIMRVEKAMGVTHSKVRFLEDALGM